MSADPNKRPDPTSVESHLAGYEDGIRKLLWNTERRKSSQFASADPSPGDLKLTDAAAAANDPGFIYRLPVDAEFRFAPPFIKQLLEGVLGQTALWIVRFVVPAVLIIALVLAVLYASARWAGILLIIVALLGAIAGILLPIGWIAWLAVIALGALGVFALFTTARPKWIPRVVFGIAAAGAIFGAIWLNLFVEGRLGPLRLGPIPRGTPVNLLMNIDPEKVGALPGAVLGMGRALAEIHLRGLEGDEAFEVFNRVAGPPLLKVSKCPDFVLDRGHWFGEHLTDQEKEELMAFLKTL